MNLQVADMTISEVNENCKHEIIICGNAYRLFLMVMWLSSEFFQGNGSLVTI